MPISRPSRVRQFKWMIWRIIICLQMANAKLHKDDPGLIVAIYIDNSFGILSKFMNIKYENPIVNTSEEDLRIVYTALVNNLTLFESSETIMSMFVSSIHFIEEMILFKQSLWIIA